MNKLSFLFAFCLIHAVLGTLTVRLNDKKAFVFTQFMGPCYKHKLPAYYENITFHTSTGKFTFDYDFVVDQTIDGNGNVLLFRFKKCPNAEALDSCSTLPTFKSSNFCGLMTSKNDVWSPILTCATPAIPCPFKKGIYRGRNCSVDMEAFKFFPLTQGYWHLESEIVDSRKKSLFCIRCQGNAIRL